MASATRGNQGRVRTSDRARPTTQRRILKNQEQLPEIIRNQRKIMRNQEQLPEIIRNQRKIMRNQEAIIKNQKKIMANQRRGGR